MLFILVLVRKLGCVEDRRCWFVDIAGGESMVSSPSCCSTPSAETLVPRGESTLNEDIAINSSMMISGCGP